MKRLMTTAAVLTLLGSGAALAQGLPPGYGAWHSGWSAYVQSQQAQLNARNAATHQGQAVTRNEQARSNAPLAANPEGRLGS
jgi:DNA-binding beta-propeller fold protein YncE